jgi:hypothetical protein
MKLQKKLNSNFIQDFSKVLPYETSSINYDLEINKDFGFFQYEEDFQIEEELPKKLKKTDQNETVKVSNLLHKYN